MNNLVSLTEINFDATVARAAEVLRKARLIAYPTETLYGLGALAADRAAVKRLRKLKGKAEPILMLVSGLGMARRYAEVDKRGERLALRFWPGPLTLIFKPRADMLKHVRAGAPGLGMRSSTDAFAKALVELLDEPVTSTSANRAGKEPLMTAQAITGEFGRKLGLIVDAGLRAGAASTVVDLTGPDLKLVREGRIKFEEIKRNLDGKD